MSEYKVENTQFGIKTNHPSYGMLEFNRRRSSVKPLFGSSIEHRDIISMTVRHASIIRELNEDWIHGKKTIVEVEMSQSQFAEAITSMNIGSGVPVTIRMTENDGIIPDCEFISKRQQFANEFKQEVDDIMSNSQNLIQQVKELFAQKKPLTKKEKECILSCLNKLNQDIGSNIAYITNQFNEQMNKTVTEAKGEIESFCQNKINSIASAALVEHKDELLKLENPVDIKLD